MLDFHIHFAAAAAFQFADVFVFLLYADDIVKRILYIENLLHTNDLLPLCQWTSVGSLRRRLRRRHRVIIVDVDFWHVRHQAQLVHLSASFQLHRVHSPI